jgi:hypothetical protein
VPEIDPTEHEIAELGPKVKDVDESPWAYAGDQYVTLAEKHAENSERIE